MERKPCMNQRLSLMRDSVPAANRCFSGLPWWGEKSSNMPGRKHLLLLVSTSPSTGISGNGGILCLLREGREISTRHGLGMERGFVDRKPRREGGREGGRRKQGREGEGREEKRERQGGRKVRKEGGRRKKRKGQREGGGKGRKKGREKEGRKEGRKGRR
ncbi:Octapeptide-repeat protein T2 [Ophiophagus hannah]|uniref:Octapeptide-repeat protein T2 n=1 Tax=Ophiophagus hannah TaxID=8665 RepID=V8NB00_OPHHA|nr:Octapeptide-repeat protein T2 [Ophiophagus hannah]